jgi:2-dehydro-3-deoxygluconokinase
MGRLATFGESMLRLSTPSGEKLEATSTLEMRTAGAESNVAITAANLGIESVWLSKVPENPLGRRVVRDLRANGVEPRVVWDTKPQARQGVYFVEIGRPPRGTRVLYDRADSAVTSAKPGALDLDAIRGADYFCTSGITPALSDTLRVTVRELLEVAASSGTRTVLDVNYRSALWSTASARDTLGELLPLVDVVVSAERDARSVFGYDGDPESIVTGLRNDFHSDVVILTRGAEGSIAVDVDRTYRQDAFVTEPIDPIGAGDAFLGGFLAHRLNGESISESLEFGSAAAALCLTVNGDGGVFTREGVESVRAGDTELDR